MRIFDLYRETSQRHFYAGRFAEKRSGVPTNSGYALELGPEVDKATLVRTRPGGPHWPQEPDGARTGFSAERESMHAHFQRDFDLHHSRIGDRVDMGPLMNRAGDPAGPLGPATGSDYRHRLARSFRLPLAAGSSASLPLPRLQAAAPSDLRIDGLYSERHAAVAYKLMQMHDAGEGVPVERRAGATGVWQLRPSSLLAFRAATTADAGCASQSSPIAIPDIIDLENYCVTSCLNHNLHPHGLESGSQSNPNVAAKDLQPNYLEAHRWMHVQMSWQIVPPWRGKSPSYDHRLVIWINGRPNTSRTRINSLFSLSTSSDRATREPPPRRIRRCRGGTSTRRTMRAGIR
ncbi:MAG: hypothetical protein HY716_12750 [Planctomycetes bacterium]|nr:hypothetical protein [Planctomycetota bacterium]